MHGRVLMVEGRDRTATFAAERAAARACTGVRGAEAVSRDDGALMARRAADTRASRHRTRCKVVERAGRGAAVGSWTVPPS